MTPNARAHLGKWSIYSTRLKNIWVALCCHSTERYENRGYFSALFLFLFFMITSDRRVAIVKIAQSVRNQNTKWIRHCWVCNDRFFRSVIRSECTNFFHLKNNVRMKNFLLLWSSTLITVSEARTSVRTPENVTFSPGDEQDKWTRRMRVVKKKIEMNFNAGLTGCWWKRWGCLIGVFFFFFLETEARTRSWRWAPLETGQRGLGLGNHPRRGG